MDMHFSLQLPWSEAKTRLLKAFSVVDLDAIQSFDLESARDSLEDRELCPCPSHGTAQCTCQYMIFIVRQKDQTPVAIEVHSHDGQTYISVVPSSSGDVETSLLDLIKTGFRKACLGQSLSSI